MKKALGIVLIIFLSITYYYSVNGPTDNSHDHEDETSHESAPLKGATQKSPFVKDVKSGPSKVTKAHDHKVKKPNQDKPVKVPDFEPKDEYEVSVVKMTELISDTIALKKDTKALRESLISLGLRPVTSVDSNPYTGTMKIVRTEKNLPGTRYFHTQVFTDENGVETIQYSAVDVKGGPGAFERTTLASAKSFKVNAKPDYQKPGFNKWSLGDGRNLWIKKMEAKDLKDDPFNAYSADDVGTIRVVVELEIHHDGDGEKHLTPVEEDEE
ncbi:MAG: hypothetical protein ACJAT2_003455 [Bacteriovoracaceae bacterium]|jgi:hypothetical protein